MKRAAERGSVAAPGMPKPGASPKGAPRTRQCPPLEKVPRRGRPSRSEGREVRVASPRRRLDLAIAYAAPGETQSRSEKRRSFRPDELPRVEDATEGRGKGR